MVAASWGNKDIVEILLAADCDPSGYDPSWTGPREAYPLQLALRIVPGSFEYFMRKLQTAVTLLPYEIFKGPGEALSAAVDVCNMATNVFSMVRNVDDVNEDEVQEIVTGTEHIAIALLTSISDMQLQDLLFTEKGEMALTNAVSANLRVFFHSPRLKNAM